VGTTALLPGFPAAQIVGGQLQTHLVLPTSGVSCALIGDLDRDGTPDYAVGDSFRYGASNVRVYSGRTNQQLLLLRGELRFGASIAALGDVDRDGYPDMLVGAPEHSPGGVTSAGSAFVYSGRSGALLRRFDGQSSYEYFGSTVAAAGDQNGDGFGDYLVSAPQADPGGLANAGSAYVFSGTDGAVLHAFHGAVASALLGGATSARDVDRDGTPDIVLGDGNGFAGGERVRVYSGRTFRELWSFVGIRGGVGIGDANGDVVPDIATADRWAGANGEVMVLSGTDGSVIHHIVGRTSQGLGTTVGWTGDVNRDGYADFGVGAGHLVIGEALVFSGRDASLLLRRPNPTQSISAAGDLNGDGFPDVLSTAYSSSAFVFGVDPFMAPTAVAMSAATGGTIGYAIDFPDTAAGEGYLVLMSASGTGPFTFGGVQIPLTIDPLMVASAQGLLAPLQNRFSGTLSSSAAASAELQIPPGLLAGLVGVDLQLAAIAFVPSGEMLFSSVANRLTVRP
jgi:hypothetical protein